MPKSKNTIKLGDLIRELLMVIEVLKPFRELYNEEWHKKKPSKILIEEYVYMIKICEEEIEKICNQLNKFEIEV